MSFSAAGAVAAFTPHGTAFNAPVTVRLRYDPFVQAPSVLTLDDPSDTTWEAVTDATYRDGVAEFVVDHFSFFRVVLPLSSLTSLTITGLTLPEATVTAEVAGQSVVAMADTDGRYSLDVPTGSPQAVVSLTAQGASSRGASRIVLASALDTVAQLVREAGSEGPLDRADVLDEAENASVVISPVTTVRYALLLEANRGNMPDSEATLFAADANAADKYLGVVGIASTSELMQGFIDDPSLPLPAGKTDTLALRSRPRRRQSLRPAGVRRRSFLIRAQCSDRADSAAHSAVLVRTGRSVRTSRGCYPAQ